MTPEIDNLRIESDGKATSIHRGAVDYTVRVFDSLTATTAVERAHVATLTCALKFAKDAGYPWITLASDSWPIAEQETSDGEAI